MIRRCAIFVACLLSSGCLSIPDDVKAYLAPPDGKRPNNFGVFVEGKQGKWYVRPDTPTIAPISTAAPSSGGGS